MVLEGGERSAEVILSGQDFKVYHSVVVFQNRQRARELMEALQINQESLGSLVEEAPTIGQETLGIFKDSSGENRNFIIFRTDEVLVRVTLLGEGSLENLLLYSRRAWEKAR